MRVIPVVNVSYAYLKLNNKKSPESYNGFLLSTPLTLKGQTAFMSATPFVCKKIVQLEQEAIDMLRKVETGLYIKGLTGDFTFIDDMDNVDLTGVKELIFKRPIDKKYKCRFGLAPSDINNLLSDPKLSISQVTAVVDAGSQTIFLPIKKENKRMAFNDFSNSFEIREGKDRKILDNQKPSEWCNELWKLTERIIKIIRNPERFETKYSPF